MYELEPAIAEFERAFGCKIIIHCHGREFRDAKGELFTSVGNVGTYNVDDPKCESFFNFSGRRLVRFPLPGNRPWDRSHLAGSCWWGASGGDSIVDYPLALEKKADFYRRLWPEGIKRTDR